MHRRRVGADDEVEIGNGGGGFGKIRELGREVVDAAGRQRRQIPSARTHLERKPAYARHVEQCGEAVERDRATLVVSMMRITGPGDTDLDAARIAEPLFPATHALSRRGKVGDLRD